MNADALWQSIIEYGADEAGMKDRFGENTALYALCFQELLESPQTAMLEEALRSSDYAAAFDAAHALKGLSGNLGLKAYYAAVCVLVESLRGKDYGHIEAEYADVDFELENLKRVFAGEEPKLRAFAVSAGEKPESEGIGWARAKMNRIKQDKFLSIAIVAILAVFLLATVAFSSIGSNYREKTRSESGEHLLETGRQIGLYLEEQIANDWKIARSVGKTLVHSNADADGVFVDILKEQQEAWGVTNLMLYTENGDCVNADGKTEANDVASETIFHAQKYGSALSIIESQIIYTLPLETEQRYRGSKIVAVSAIRSMDTLLDDLDFTSFENEAWLYLTDDRGVVISMLTKTDAVYTFNVYTLFKDQTIVPLSENADAENVFAPAPSAYYTADEAEDKYLISIPISTDDTDAIRMRLFYIVPETVVNSTSNEFSKQLAVFSVIIIGLLVGLASLAFLAIYRNRKKKFDAALSAREQMFDLLIQNIRSVFGLFNADKAAPVYVSGNVVDVLGEEYWAIEKTENGYRASTASGRETTLLCQANELLAAWDGNAIFKSGYLCDDTVVPPVYFELTLYPVGENGSDFVGIMQDVTAAHDREEATKNAMEMAKRSNEAKTRFLANMSHDIRTPMNAIMNMSGFVLEGVETPEKREEYLHTINESSGHLLHIINDVLDMSRIESGQTVIAAEPFHLKAELERQVETVRPLCVAKGQTLLVSLDGIRAEAVQGDALKVAQIIMNLLSNAMKFTPDGGVVRFAATELPSLREEMVNIRFTVEDNGIGISAENKKYIFEPFFRAGDKHVESLEGTGLGLPICKNYVEAMGGTITCESEMGKGSIFTVELFFQKAGVDETARADACEKDGTPFLGLRCLVAEDIHTNQVIAKTLLERVGFEVDLVNNGSEAVKRFESVAPKTYDVIYLDIQMPVLDGYQAAAMIRQSDHPKAKTMPILAMSANVFVEDIERARIAGMDGYIGKPIVSRELTEQTLKAIRKRKG